MTHILPTPAVKRPSLETEQMKNPVPYLSTGQAARRAGVVVSTVVNWATRNPALGRKIQGRWRIDPAQLERILDGQPDLRNSR